MEKHILSEMTNKNFSKAVNEIYLLTDYNHLQYPDYYKWFYGKSVPRLFDKTGEMIFYLDGFNVAGLTILKKDLEELKICTLLVNEEYRKKGYGKLIVEDAFQFLGTDKPLITIADNKLDQFKKIIDAYGWQEMERINDYYSEEVIFNKVLKK